MAEALGVAASVVSLVAITGQIVQTITYLSDFFQSIKDAPEDVQILTTELAILRPLAEQVNTRAKQCHELCGAELAKAEIEPGLKYCADSIASLQELVKKYDGKFDRRGGRMRKVGFVFGSKQFDKHIARLERSKGYLMFAQNALISATQTEHYRLSQGILSNVENLEQEVTSGIASLRVDNSRTGDIAAETRNLAREILENSHALDMVLESMPKWGDVTGLEDLSPMIAASIKSAVADVLNQQKDDWNKVKARPRRVPRRPYSMNPLSSLHEEMTLDMSTKTHENGMTSYTEHSVKEDLGVSMHGPNAEIRYLGTRSIIKTQTSWHQTNFWFGTLHIHGTRRTTQKEDTESGELIKSEETSQTDLKFIPARWLFRKGAIATMTWVTKNFQQPIISMGLQVFNVVERDSQIIEACKNCDLATIRRLFDERIASPLDRDADGYILTDWVIYSMIERLATWETPWIKDLRSCFGVCRFLIETCGLDPSQSQSHKWAASNRSTAWTTLLMFQIRNRGHKHAAAAAPWFERILRLLICKAKTNPFAQAKDSLADVLELQVRHLDSPIVDSSFSIIATQEIWSIEWDESLGSDARNDQNRPEFVHYPEALRFVEKRMIPATIIASEAAARSLRPMDEIQETFRKWSVMLEKVLEDAPNPDDFRLMYLIASVIIPAYDFTMLRPSESTLKIFKTAIRNMMVSIMRYAERRKFLTNGEEKELKVVGYGTWKVSNPSDVLHKIEFDVFKDCS